MASDVLADCIRVKNVMSQPISIAPSEALNGPTSQRRLLYLDSMRGLAALVVIFYHMTLVLPRYSWKLTERGVPIWDMESIHMTVLTLSPLGFLFDGRAAVLLFFVLSGFVLAMPFLNGRTPSLQAFAAKRAIRLLLPTTVVVLLVAAALPLIDPQPRPDLSEWFNNSWQHVSPASLLRHLLLAGGGYQLNNVLWTLEAELHVSMVFPLIFLLLRGTGGMVAAMFCIGILVALFADFLPRAVIFLPHFLLGILLARRRESISSALRRMSSMGRLGLCAICYALINVRWLTDAPPDICDWATGAGAALLIALVMASPAAQHLLARRSLAWLGAISYSLYLVHVPIILGIIHLAPREIAIVWLLLPVMPLSLLAAVMLHRVVERPSIVLAARAAARIDMSTARQNA